MTEKKPADQAGAPPVDSTSPGADTAMSAAPEKDAPSAAPEHPPLPKLPKAISINEFREKPLSEIYSMLEVLPERQLRHAARPGKKLQNIPG